MIMHDNTKFGNKMFGSLEDIICTNVEVLTLCCALTLNAVIIFFHKTLRLMMIYLQTKFFFLRISSSEDTVDRVIF